MSDTERFIELVLDPATWEEKAHHLVEAAALFEGKLAQFWQGVRSGTGWHDEFVAIYFMLSAFAIENLLKARLVRTHRPDIESQLRSGASLPDLLKGHDLHELTLRAGLRALANEEESLLRRLSRSSVWYARYPAPVRAAELERLRPSCGGETSVSLSAYSSADRNDILRIVRELGGAGAAGG